MPADRPSTSRRPALRPVAGVFALALAVRVTAVLAWSRALDPQGDEAFYWRQAQYLGQGVGFVYRNNYGEQVPTAVHPPLYSAYLGVLGLLRLPEGSHLPYRLATALAGAVAVALVALVAYRIAGRGAAWAAGVLAAVYPNLWFNDAKLTAESVYAVAVAAMLLAVEAYHRRPSTRAVAWVGATVAVAALGRAEALFLFPLLVAPLVLLARSQPLAVRFRQLVVGGVVGLVVVAPWLGRNLLTFERPSTISTGSGFVIEISNCEESFGLPSPRAAPDADPSTYLGYWVPACDRSSEAAYGAAAVPWPEGDETVVEAQKRQIGLDFVSAHRDRLPVVLAARVGRIWDVWRPGQSVDLNSFFEGRNATTDVGPVTIQWQWFAMGQHFLLLALVVPGMLAMRRRGATLLPYLALAAVATLAAAVSFGITRYRVGADVGLAVLGGVGAAWLWSLRPRSTP